MNSSKPASGATRELFLEFLGLLWFATRLLGAVESVTETNVVYRTGTVSDAMRKSCRLDIHYPVGATNPPTVVWFHGGVHTGHGAMAEPSFPLLLRFVRERSSKSPGR